MSDDLPAKFSSFLARPKMDKPANQVADQLLKYIKEAERAAQGMAVVHATHLDAQFAVIQRAQAIRDAETNQTTRNYMDHLIHHAIELMVEGMDEITALTSTSIEDHLVRLRYLAEEEEVALPEPKDERSWLQKLWEAGS